MRHQARLATPGHLTSTASSRFGRASPKATLACLQDAAESAPSAQRQMALQRLADGRNGPRLPTAAAPVQRSVDTAAQALFNAGTITVKGRDLSKKFCTDHAVTKGDLDAIQTALDVLRAANPREVHEVVDMTDQANWPTEGGMVEGDGADVAGVLGWAEDGTRWNCSDRAHSPKGKVYVDGSGNYFGADNTGHVGWGFKVWIKKNKTTLDYAGNYSWDGAAWVHDARGTGRAMK